MNVAPTERRPTPTLEVDRSSIGTTRSVDDAFEGLTDEQILTPDVGLVVIGP